MKPEEAIEAAVAIEAETDIETVRATATDLGIKFSGNSGIDTIKGKILEALAIAAKDEVEETEEVEVEGNDESLNFLDKDDDEETIEVAKAVPAGPSIEELLKMDAKKIKDPGLRRKVIRAQALKLTRVIITNLDASENQLDSVLITALNKYTGKVSRVVPFDNPWHVEEILLKQLRNQKFVMRKEKKGGKFGVKQYTTAYAKKYAIEVLPQLTTEERAELAAAQRASGAIDKPV